MNYLLAVLVLEITIFQDTFLGINIFGWILVLLTVKSCWHKSKAAKIIQS